MIRTLTPLERIGFVPAVQAWLRVPPIQARMLREMLLAGGGVRGSRALAQRCGPGDGACTAGSVKVSAFWLRAALAHAGFAGAMESAPSHGGGWWIAPARAAEIFAALEASL